MINQDWLQLQYGEIEVEHLAGDQYYIWAMQDWSSDLEQSMSEAGLKLFYVVSHIYQPVTKYVVEWKNI